MALMKTIVFLETVITFGGARKSTVELAARLNQAGYRVLLYDVYGTCKPFIEACKEEKIDLKIIYPSSDSHIISSDKPFKRIVKKIGFVFHLLKINKLLRNRLLEDKPDYIIVNNSKVLTYLFRKTKDTKIILFARGWFIGKQIRKIDRFLYKKMVDRYVCVSEATRHAIYGAGLAPLKDIFVVHNAIDEKSMQKDIEIERDPNVFKILISGGFLPTKGLHLSIEIAKQLKKKNIPFKIIITGIIYKSPVSSQYFEKVKQLIDENDLANHIEIVANHTDVREYFKWCDVLVHPSDTEGLPRVVMEAMIMKKPVIANAVGGVTDYILDGYTGFITNYNCVGDYVNYLEMLYKDKNLYDNISCRAFELIKTCYTPERQIESMKKIFQ